MSFSKNNTINFTICIAVVFAIAFSALFSACDEINIQDIDTDSYYIGDFSDNSYIVKFDTISPKNIIGKRYKVSDTPFPSPENMTIKVGRKKCTLTICETYTSIKVIPQTICSDSISGTYSIGKSEKHFCLHKYKSPEFKEYEAQFTKEKYKVDVIKDVVYGKAKGFWSYNPETNETFAKQYIDKLGELIKYNISPRDIDLKLDIYVPKNDTSKSRPLLMLIHGGAFFNGDKASEAYIKWSTHFAAMGFVVASINYRMGFLPSANQIDCAGYRAVQDAHAATRYMISNAKKYRINTDWIFAGGTSAGAITALNLAFMRNPNRPEASKGNLIKDDLGNIESVSPQYKGKVSIKAVANMWGAVHDIRMIANAKTSIISFHGDADKIVPYGYDYPFKDMLDPIKMALKDDSRLSLPLNERVTNKMYGSSYVNKTAQTLGNKSKLYTYPGGGHSLHVDENDNLVPYFYFIQDSVTAFFIDEIITDPVKITQDANDKSIFRSNSEKIKDLKWKADDGIILESDKKHAKIIFVSKGSKKIYISGHYNNGVGFHKELTL